MQPLFFHARDSSRVPSLFCAARFATNAAPSLRSENTMDTASNSDSDSDSKYRLDMVAKLAASAHVMLVKISAAATGKCGGRKPGAASHTLVSELDGSAWQYPSKQDAPPTVTRASGIGKRARLAKPAGRVPRLRKETEFFKAGAAPAPSALHRAARAESPAN